MTYFQTVERMLQSFPWQSKASKIDGDGQGVTYVTPLLHDKAMYMQYSVEQSKFHTSLALAIV